MKQRLSKLLILFFLALICAAALPARADDTNTEAKERWSQLTSEEKIKIRDNYIRWKGLSEERKKQLRERYERFHSLRSEDRQRVIDNFRRFRSMPPQRQMLIRTRFEQFQKFTPQQQVKRLEIMKEHQRQKRDLRRERRGKAR